MCRLQLGRLKRHEYDRAGISDGNEALSVTKFCPIRIKSGSFPILQRSEKSRNFRCLFCSYIVSYIAEALVGNHSQLDNKQLICNHIWVLLKCIFMMVVGGCPYRFSCIYHLTGEWHIWHIPACYNVLFTLRPLFLAAYIKADVSV